VNESKDAMNDQLPDRLSTDPKSPYAKDRYGNPLTIKVHGPVEPYFRDKASS
jgi:hypothetical protein